MFIRSFLIRSSIVALCLFEAATVRGGDKSSLTDLVVNAVILGNPSSVAPGEEFSYAFVVTNQGADMPAGSTTKVLSHLPPRVNFVLAEEGARGKLPFFLGVSCTQSAPIIHCEGPPLVKDDFFVVRIIAQVQPDAQGGILINHVLVDPQNEVAESLENNNLDTVKVKIE